jgi:hypothetical protein
MTLYAGMNIDLKVRGTDGFSRKIITDASCTINLYGPGKDPQSSPSDRADPDVVLTATYDSVSRYYLATASTTGWAPGTWWMQGVLSGGEEGYYAFDFESFTLNP